MVDTKGSDLSTFTPVITDRIVGVDDPAGTPASGTIVLSALATLLNSTAKGAITFTPGAAPSHAEGLLFYDSGEKALSYYNDEADVTLNIGQESVIRVRNESGGALANGSVVYVTGTQVGGEERMLIDEAIANAQTTSRVIGVVTHDIEDNSYGYVTQFGEVHDFDTSALSVGPVWLSESVAGALTNTEPVSPNFAVFVGYVTTSDASVGELFVTTIGNTNGTAGEATELTQPARKGSAGTINKGQAVYVSGYNSGQGVIEVELADADSASAMPAVGLANESVTNSATGDIVTSGIVSGFNTSGFSAGDELYVSTTAGGLTNTKPTATAEVQKVAIVLRSHASLGAVLVIGAGRSNDVPNFEQYAEKTTPLSVDTVLVKDTEDSDNLKEVQIGNIGTPLAAGFTANPQTTLADDDYIGIFDPDDGTPADRETAITYANFKTELESDLGFEPADADILKADVGDTLTAGFITDSYSGGTQSGAGTYTPAPATGQENIQHIVNGGAFALAPPAAPCSVVVEIVNNGSAGAITTSGFDKVSGDSFDTTDTNGFLAYITVTTNYSSLYVEAMQ